MFRLASIGLFASVLSAQPFIYRHGVLNAASFMAPGAPGGAIAQGALFSIFGSGLGPDSAISASSYPLQTNLAGVTVKVSTGGMSVNAYPVFAGASQLNVIMPSNAPLGRVSVQVTYSGSSSNPAPINVVPGALGIFSVNSAGFGPGVLTNYVSSASQPVNSLQASAVPGQVITLWGTGLGPVTGGDNVAPPAGNLKASTEVFVGGVSATVSYHGRSPCCAAEDQIVFTVPENAPTGCYVPVLARVAGTTVSNAVTMAISSKGGACSDPANPAAQAIAAGGNIGAIVAQRIITSAPTTDDSVFADFRKIASGPWAFDSVYSLPPLGTCTTYVMEGDVINGSALLPGEASTANVLAAGANLTAQGPGGSIQVPGPAPFGALLGGQDPAEKLTTPFFDVPGGATFSTSGGTDVDPITANVNTPAGITWTNQNALGTINRSKGFTVTWSGGNPASDNAIVVGIGENLSSNVSTVVICLADVSVNSFIVAPPFLANLAATNLADTTTAGALFVGSLPMKKPGQFSAKGLNTGIAAFSALDALAVAFQ